MMKSKKYLIYHAQEIRDRDNKNKEPEMTRRNFDSRRVSTSILKEILGEIHKVNENNVPYTMDRVIKIKKAEVPRERLIEEPVPERKRIPLNKPTSMTSLILWNVSKAIELKPNLNLKATGSGDVQAILRSSHLLLRNSNASEGGGKTHEADGILQLAPNAIRGRESVLEGYQRNKNAIREAKQRLDKDTNGRDLSANRIEDSEEQHLLYALLAWQQLGHHDAESLCRFIEEKTEEIEIKSKHRNSIHESIKSTAINRHPCTPWKTVINKPSVDGSFGFSTTGPIVRLPVESVIMRLGNDPHQCCRHGSTSKRQERDIMKKMDEACCMDERCAEALAALDSKTKELRSRAAQLARREAQRVQLLERAEAAWSDLESGYEKRLALATEKEEDLKKQIKKIIEEQNNCDCTKDLPEELKNKGDQVKKARAKLTELETVVCDLANTRLRLSEESAKGEAALAQELCKAAQYDRDLKFQEEQARRTLESVKNEAESARALTCEAERALRAELAGLRKQIGDVSKELLSEDKDNIKIKEEHEQLRKEKAELIEDLEGCKSICDQKMQGELDALMKKKEKLLQLQEEVLKCQCQVPVDAHVQVKRTPSLAAMCYCAPEDNLEESCSCTSLRDRLLSSLLSDLFSGLQNELGMAGAQMPCQLLKCLQDSHNWDRRTDTKSNLRSFFTKLLRNELDIAIATSIENYHAKWVGTACADSAKMIPTAEDDLKEGWQARAIERRAQQMANQLAAELLQEHAVKLEQQTLEKLKALPPPCVCKPGSNRKTDPENTTALFPVLTRPSSPFIPVAATNSGTPVDNPQPADTSALPVWMQTIQDITQLKLQIEDLKKDAIKKEDLELMKHDISKIVRKATAMENESHAVVTKESSKLKGESKKKETRSLRPASRDGYPKTSNQNKIVVAKQKENKNVFKKGSIKEKPTKLSKKQVHDQSYAVNLCLCGPGKDTKSLQNAQLDNSGRSTWKQRSLKDMISLPQSSNVKQTKPINFNLPPPELLDDGSEISDLCNSNCKCFNKVPSLSSIDKLLEVLASCNYDSVSRETCIKYIKSCLSNCSETAINEVVRALNQNDSKNILSFLTGSYKNQENDSDINEDTAMKTGKQNRSFSKQPGTSESEYMGTVYFDKSHENICKCIMNLVQSNKGNNSDKNEDCNNNISFQCINTNTCGCSINHETHKDNKRSQTEKLYKKKKPSNHCQVTQLKSKDVSKFNEFSTSPINSCLLNYLHNQTDITQKPNVTNIPQNTELFSKGGECCIKFLGVTLNDVSQNKKMETVEHNISDLISPKKKHLVCGKKLPKSCVNEQSNLLMKQNVLPKESHNATGVNDSKNCECKAKLEEFTSFMKNAFDEKLLKNTQKDQVVNTQKDQVVNTHKDRVHDIHTVEETRSLRNTVHTIESCFCSNSVNVDDSGDLEINAFHLLEDHIKEKLEEFKSFSCNNCIPPDEEQKLFSNITQRVRQVISDYANKMKCGCSKGLPYNGSWNRAYGLLQEYLKIKIKRVQCLCLLNDKKKDIILPEVLEKVCNLIENDFERLRDICTCKTSSEPRTKIVRIEDLKSPTELPEKDTNISQAKYNDVEVQLSTVMKHSKQNSNNSMIVKENMSSQVHPSFRMETKSCDIMGTFSNRNISQIIETDHIITDTKSNGVMINTCDCCYNTDKVDIRKFPEMFGTKEVFVNLYAEQAINTTCEFSEFHIKIEPPEDLSAGRVSKAIPIKEMSENDESMPDAEIQADKQTPCAPYFGLTVGCNCDSELGSWFSMQSVDEVNNDKIDSVRKEYLESENIDTNFSNIMQGTQIINSDDVVNCRSVLNEEMIDETSKTALPNDDTLTGKVEIIVKKEDETVLEYSLETDDFSTNAANTFDERLSLDTADTFSISDVSAIDWLQNPVTIRSRRSNAINLAKSIYFPGLKIDNEKNYSLSGSGIETDSQKKTEACSCEKVPICHVKMLVEHIEKNLVEFKCTCDSLMSKVCPEHSKRVF